MGQLPFGRGSTWKVGLLIGLGVVGAYFLLPSPGAMDAGYSVIGLASVAAVLVGIRINRPVERRGWFAIAAGNLCFVLGDGVYDVYAMLHRSVPFPSVADAFYLAGYPLLIVGVVCLTRPPGQAQGSRESYADAAIVTFGGLALFWHFLMASYADNSEIGAFGTLVTFAYPLMDLSVLFIVFRGLVLGYTRNAAMKLLAIAMASMIVADFGYDLLSLHGVYSVGDPLDAGWLINYVLVGVAALHPATATELLPAVRKDSGRRLPVVALAGFVAPLILLVADLSGPPADVGALAGISIVLFALVVVRLRWMVARIALQARSLEEALAARTSLETELRHQAFHDSLTGLANRALLQDRVDRALAAASRNGANVVVCFCDLDGFKTVNDSLGHLVGDAVLIAAGERLLSVVRPGDTVARFGGDEFAVLLEGVKGPAVALELAERIVSVLGQPMRIQDRRIELTVSVGVAVADAFATTERLLSSADSAMYEAKAAGKGRFRLFETAMHDRITERFDVSTALGVALVRSELFLQYQPQFSLTDNHLVGFEALLRWRHPTLGLLHPDRFISVAEETGHIVPIGRWVIEKASEQAAQWSRLDGAELTMSVNLSGRQLGDNNLADDVRTALALSGLPPRRFVLEVTESVLIADNQRSLRILDELKTLGVRLAIDDFGTGYSSLSYLRRMPVDELKIDKSFVDALAGPSGEDPAFITTIIRLAKTLDLHVVAEGIETARQQELLTDLGCDTGQGFALGRPLDPADATALLRTSRRSGLASSRGDGDRT